MFETAVVHAQTQAPERRVGLLTASVGIHTLAGAAIIIASIQSLNLPTHSPKQMSTFSFPVIELPRQIGDPHGSAQVTRPRPAQAARTITAPPADAAPQVIPSQTTVAAAATTTGTGDPNSSGPGNGQPLGDPNGVENGLPLAQLTSSPVVAEPKIYRASEVNPPVVITRVSPEFPRIAQMAHKSGWAVVECVIDSSGHIRDAHLAGSSWEVFDKPALDAVQQWVFKPGTLNGQAVNTLFELRVTFTLH